ncbi:MAG: TetR/AcrR family transcriptional regulator [Clostridia bacterium]|nr:TetR/AcrR family transcriptional regulator [Clostridia bacterium]
MQQKLKTQITKQKILEAAEEEFSALGFAAARVDQIAASAGVNKQMIYAHFESKEGLYRAVLEAVYARLTEEQSRIAAGGYMGRESIAEVIENSFCFLRQNPHFVRLMMWENLSGGAHAELLHIRLFEGAACLLRKGMEKGEIRADLDVDQTVMSLNMFCFSAFSNVHTLSKLLQKDLLTDKALSERAQHITRVFMRYIFGD